MLYTGKGDKGSTTLFASPERVSKTSTAIELLGALDELNSFLGICKVKAVHLADKIEEIQHDLFTIQAEVAGSSKRINDERTRWLSSETDELEKQLEPISTFFLSGSSEASALLDYARTLTRSAERRAVGHNESGEGETGGQLVSPEILSYLNRLSSLLYALARHEATTSGIKEKPPKYR